MQDIARLKVKLVLESTFLKKLVRATRAFAAPMVVNLNARDRAIAAHAAAAKYGKLSPYEEATSRTPSRPSSAKPSRPSSAKPSVRPSSAGTTHSGKPGGSIRSGSPKRGKGSPRSPRLHWGVNFSVPRSFVEIAAGQHTDWLELNLGPKELKFRELGAKLEADALEAAVREAVQARSGLERRRRAEKACKENRNSTGEPWRHGRHGGGHGDGSGPIHLPSRRNRTGPGDGGLFSPMSPLEATESALRYRKLLEARRSQRRSRPSSAPLTRGPPSRLT